MNGRRRGGGLTALVVLVVIAALLAGALYYLDGRFRAEAEGRAAATLQTRLGTPTPPQVDIAGPFFLPQVVSGTLSSVHVVADQLGQTTDAGLRIQHVDLTLTDVTSPDRFQTMTAAHGVGTARVDYDQIKRLVSYPLNYAGGGRFTVDASTSVLGVPVKAQVTGGLGLNEADQTVSLTNAQVEVAGVTVPEAAAQAILPTVLKPVPITGLPYDLRLTDLQARDDGLHVDVTGDNIALSQ